MYLTAFDEGIPKNGWSRTSLDRLVQKLMLIVRLTGVLVAVIPNPSERLTTGIDLQSRGAHIPTMFYVAPPIVVHSNYVKFAAEYCYKLPLICAKVIRFG